ncbi:MAG: replicative DNA helicase [Pirellulales bacterium]
MATVQRVDRPAEPVKINSEILDRQPPRNLEAEKAVLGSLLLLPEMCDEVALVLRPEHFYDDANQKLYAHMMGLHDEGRRFDTTLLIDRLKNAGDFEAIGGLAYLAAVAQSVPTAANAVHYANIVQEKATLRWLIYASTEILRDAYDEGQDSREMINRAEEKIFAIHEQKGVGNVLKMHDVLMEAFEHIDARLQRGGATGIPTGLNDLDNLTGGLHNSELAILAARPSMGKTALATNIAEHVTVGLPEPVATLFVSLEMSRLELAQRMLCSRGRIDGNKFRSGYLSGDDHRKLAEASSELSRGPLFVDDSPSRTMTEIAAVARRLKRKEKLALVIIDYLQLIEPDNPRDPRQEQVAKIARRLKGLARELKVPVLCLAQLNRQAEATKDNRPRLSHLRESGAIEQDADVVMFVHREEYYHTREEAQAADLVGKAEIIVAKQRNGPTDDVKVNWLGQFTRFANLSQREGEDFYTYDPA